MKVSELKEVLNQIHAVNFELPDGSKVPNHFHVTEIGKVSKHFIDCGGTERKEEKVTFQLWTAEDYDHRLAAEKFKGIVELAETRLNLPDAEIEVEFQSETIGKYGLSFYNGKFILVTTQTDCLAKDKCGIPESKAKVKLSELTATTNSCDPGSGCC